MLDFLNTYKIVFLRAAIYMFIPGATLFLSQTETMSSHDWTNMGVFLHNRLYFSCVVASITALASYMDGSMHRTREKYETDVKIKKEQETAFLYRSQVKDIPAEKKTTL